VIGSDDQEIRLPQCRKYLGEAIVEALGQVDRRIGDHLRSTYVTLQSLFRLDEEVLDEVLEPLSNFNLAALAYGLGEAERGLILGRINERRRELVQEEIDRLAARGRRQATAAHEDVRRVVVTRLRGMSAVDATGLAAIEELHSRLIASGRSLLLCGAKEHPARMINQPVFVQQIGAENICIHIQAALDRAGQIMREREQPVAAGSED